MTTKLPINCSLQNWTICYMPSAIFFRFWRKKGVDWRRWGPGGHGIYCNKSLRKVKWLQVGKFAIHSPKKSFSVCNTLVSLKMVDIWYTRVVLNLSCVSVMYLSVLSINKRGVNLDQSGVAKEPWISVIETEGGLSKLEFRNMFNCTL